MMVTNVFLSLFLVHLGSSEILWAGTGSTGVRSLLPQCLPGAAATLNDSWRKPNSNKNIKNQDAGILDYRRTWFRFDSAAGGQLSTSCPHPLTCGSVYSYWSNSPMPQQVGETRLIYLNLYHSTSSQLSSYLLCNPPTKNAVEGRATRCSDKPGDLVYRIEGALDKRPKLEGASICSMDA